MEISIHALLAESDPINDSVTLQDIKFLSTLSLRRATQAKALKISALCDFYPRSPCGERPSSVNVSVSGSTISIHALLAESDMFPVCNPKRKRLFLSTLSLRRATKKDFKLQPRHNISIHALLAESDAGLIFFLHDLSLFLSTLSLRRATMPSEAEASALLFLSTLSLRRATRFVEDD